MKRVFIYVEGQTEETFVQNLLNDHFASIGIYLQPILATTKRVRAGKNFRGGITSYNKFRDDIRRLLNDTSISAVTTMIDYYGLPSNFPGMLNRPDADCYARVQHIEQELSSEINDHRFLPFCTLHEFEALLFSEPTAATAYLPNAAVANKMVNIRDQYSSPEEINEGRQSHPSHRIVELINGYQKTLHGPLLALETGLPPIRNACPHFDQWLSQLESLS